MRIAVLAKFRMFAGAAFLLAAGVVGQTAETVGWYTGNLSADTFYIANANELRGLAQIVNGNFTALKSNFLGKTIVLTNNIGSLGSWTPIGTNDNRFYGTFDGNGKTISGMSINNATLEYAGLFGWVGGGRMYRKEVAIKNLGLVNVNITANGAHGVGAVTGFIDGSIENCFSTGTVTGASSVGGLAGLALGTITNSYSSATVRGSDVAGIHSIGGLIGEITEGTVENCYSTGIVIGQAAAIISQSVGGLVGTISEFSIVQNSAALNPSININNFNQDTSVIGYAVGRINYGGTLINNIVFNSIKGNVREYSRWVGGSSIIADVISIYLEPTLGSRFASTGGWTVEEDKLPGLFGAAAEKPAHLRLYLKSVGKGTAADPYMIYTASQLAMLADSVNAGDTEYISGLNNARSYKLAKDIDLDVAPYNTGKGWTPIGTENNPSNVFFDGGGNKITGLYINDSTLDYAGLFGYVHGYNIGTPSGGGTAGARITNLRLEDVDISGGNYVGSLAGTTTGSVVNCHVTGTVRGNGNYVGGLVGQFMQVMARTGGGMDSIAVSYFSGAVSGKDYVGGVVGQFKRSITSSVTIHIANCYTTGTVDGNNDVGGIAGDYDFANALSNCYSLSAVTGENLVGGVVGSTNGNIENCYSAGAVSGNLYVGGLIGFFSENGELRNSAALNPTVSSTNSNFFGGRAIGWHTSENSFENIRAFDRMIDGTNSTSWPPNIMKNGADISIAAINADSTIGGLFTGAPWTTANGKLPGLFGGTVDMPAHLVPPPIIAVAEGDRVIPGGGSGAETAIAAPAASRTLVFSVGPNPVGRQSGSIGLYISGAAFMSGAGALTVYDANGNVVNKITIIDNFADARDDGRRRVGTWDLTDRQGKPVPAGAYLITGTVSAVNGKKEKVSAVIGVR